MNSRLKNNLGRKTKEFSRLSEILKLLAEEKNDKNKTGYNISEFDSGLDASFKSEKYLLGIKFNHKDSFSYKQSNIKNKITKSGQECIFLNAIKDKNGWYDDIKHTLIDFDGTLVDSKNVWIKAYRLYCKKMQIQFNKQSIKIFKEKTFEEWLQFLNCNYNDLLVIAIKLFEKLIPKADVVEIFNNLNNDCKITIISREPIEIVENWIKKWRLYNVSNIIVAGNERKFPEYYDVKNLMLIDDNYNHCKAAKMAGAKVVGVNDYHSLENQEKMLKVCDKYFY